jgi:DedD protein
MAEQQQDVDTLKRRGRRRLVGALALVLLAVIVLPMVFDPAPRRSAPPVSVRIPGEDDSAFKPKPPPRPPAPKALEKPAAEAKLEEKKPEEKKAEEKKPEEKKAGEKKAEERKPEEKKAADPERARAEAALANAEYIVPVGAFANPEPVIARLAQAKLRYYTEDVATAKGTVTRVRAGPFATKAEADKAVAALKRLGLNPGAVSNKAG